MGYTLNTRAYKLFVQVEVGLRELLIQSIRNIGVYEWTTTFLGTNQRLIITDVMKRINARYKDEKLPEVIDEYVYKLNRAKNESKFLTSKLFHPFYYLNWTDIENLMRLKNNIALLDKQIGKLNREAIVETLRPLSHLRNDIAHARFITLDDYKFIKASYDKISLLIPSFNILTQNQSSEQNVDFLIANLKSSILKIEDAGILSLEEIDSILLNLSESENSFWLNTENLELVKMIKELKIHVKTYKVLREKQGGLLDIQKLKPVIANSASKIKNLTYG